MRLQGVYSLKNSFYLLNTINNNLQIITNTRLAVYKQVVKPDVMFTSKIIYSLNKYNDKLEEIENIITTVGDLKSDDIEGFLNIHNMLISDTVCLMGSKEYNKLIKLVNIMLV